MRLFVVDSPRRNVSFCACAAYGIRSNFIFQAATLGCGLAFLVASFVVVGLLSKHTAQLVTYSVTSTMAD
jgi:hypothetical protein